MKKLLFIAAAVIGISLLYSCSKDDKEPILDMTQTQKPVFATPANGAEFILLEAQAAQPFVFQWSPTVYNIEDLPATKYILQMDVNADFSTAITLVSSENISWETTVEGLNQKLIGLGLPTGEASTVYVRVMSFMVNNTGYESIYSEALTLSVTPYSAVVYMKPIYLLGSATSAGWSNTAALPMTWIGEGKFVIIETLAANEYLKFISKLGNWAPQWGTDATGTPEGGPLSYRPDETVTDPPAIPSPAVAGDYRIEADTVNLTYTVTPASAQLFLLGDGTPAGWDNTAALPMTKVSPGIFEISVELGGDGKYLKFIEVLGQWAPQYGTDAAGTNSEGALVYRPDETVADPPAIPCPATAGTYTVKVNLIKMTYTIQ